jgi:hypothetical protein
MDPPHYVHTDVTSDVYVVSMLYYTHHNNMHALQYVQVDVAWSEGYGRST